MATFGEGAIILFSPSKGISRPPLKKKVTCGYFSVHYQSGRGQRFGVLLAFGSLLAMVFDVIENVLMSFSIHITATSFTSMLTTAMAAIKFLLIGLALLYIIFSAALMLLRKKTKPVQP